MHTKEPWKVGFDDGSGQNWILSGETVVLRGGKDDWGIEIGVTDANARRIVACVNACEGIPDGLLMPKMLPQMVLEFEAAINARNELLAALKLARKHLESIGLRDDLIDYNEVEVDKAVIYAAIDKIEGGSDE